MTNLDEKKIESEAMKYHNWGTSAKQAYIYGYTQAIEDQADKIKNLELALKIKNEVCEAINDNGQQAFLLQQRNQKLEKAVKLMRETIRFYGNKENWEWNSEFHGHEYFMRIVSEDDETYALGHHGGKKARQTLAEVDSILKGAE